MLLGKIARQQPMNAARTSPSTGRGVLQSRPASHFFQDSLLKGPRRSYNLLQFVDRAIFPASVIVRSVSPVIGSFPGRNEEADIALAASQNFDPMFVQSVDQETGHSLFQWCGFLNISHHRESP
jgi:hypothetical protein